MNSKYFHHKNSYLSQRVSTKAFIYYYKKGLQIKVKHIDYQVCKTRYHETFMSSYICLQKLEYYYSRLNQKGMKLMTCVCKFLPCHIRNKCIKFLFKHTPSTCHRCVNNITYSVLHIHDLKKTWTYNNILTLFQRKCKGIAIFMKTVRSNICKVSNYLLHVVSFYRFSIHL